jgi:peptidoglycan/xylan/chitin deacetylase (PgdA/CDA1 family)
MPAAHVGYRQHAGNMRSSAGGARREMRALDRKHGHGAGCEIGFHTRRHDVLPELDDARLAAAMHVGPDALVAAAGAPLRAIAYPHGAADARVAAAARAAAFGLGVTTEPDAVVAGSDPLLLGRIYPSSASVGGLAMSLAQTLWRARRRRG